VARGSIRYARVGDASIAYRVLGERGPYLAIVLGVAPGLLVAEHPATRDFVERMSRFARPVVFDVQGTGRSDPLPPGVAASVEHQTKELMAVLTAAGIGSAYVWGTDFGGAVAVSVAVQQPDLVSGLMLANTCARLLRDDDYPWGVDRATLDGWLCERQDLHGTRFPLDLVAPSVAHDPEVREFWNSYQEQMSSPAQSGALDRIVETLDVRSLLPQVQAPTLVMHTAADTLLPIEHGRYLAEHIPNARFVEVPGRAHIVLWESAEFFYDEFEAFVTGTRPSGEAERVLAAVLFTDLAASTERARQFGDRRWRRLLDEYECVCAEQIERFRGRLVKYTGDGVLATFGSVSDATAARSPS
jgi:pimeloyl-ACP methyl ester carboxylesterase